MLKGSVAGTEGQHVRSIHLQFVHCLQRPSSRRIGIVGLCVRGCNPEEALEEMKERKIRMEAQKDAVEKGIVVAILYESFRLDALLPAGYSALPNTSTSQSLILTTTTPAQSYPRRPLQSP